MEHIKKINIWLFLPVLFVAKLWAAIDKGNAGPWNLAIMVTCSVLLLLYVERNTAMRSIAWQGVLCISYIALVLFILFALGLREKELSFVKSLIPYSRWPMFLIDAFGAAVSEEIIFRKFLLCSLLKRMRPIYAIVLSSLIFYLCHFSIMATIIISGIFYASVALRWNSLLLAIGMHTIYDFLGNMALSVGQVSVTIIGDLNAYQVLHGAAALSDFIFIAAYFTMIFAFDIISACAVKIKTRRKIEEIAS
ncbi:CPBP family intramembrane glutamic endopeptidase [Massilia sp. Root335]|jgi:membrane protease YdiL (CAAX protease family)|uniref:CPBP family intramembrane glutamic endopeptidase n=1 Tax=Massilia sp. Root335 TaxID=1736517 RepID=UPI0009E83F7C|nr:CPBP family intramembrane glutamic endopeptidase [Massilia sp. Root335]